MDEEANMSTFGRVCLLACVAVLPCVAAEPAPPGAVMVLDKDEAYKKSEAKEQTLDGMLERIETTGRVGPVGRFNVYQLKYDGPDGKPVTRELHAPGKAYLLASHVGKKVRVLAKLVEGTEDGKKYAELWPAWAAPLSGEIAERPAADGIFARCDWQPDEARVRGQRTYVFRDGEQLAKAMRITGPSASETATALLATRLRLPAIDWSKHMVICVCAGLQSNVEGLAIVKVGETSGKLRVNYRMTPANTTGFGFPAQTALVLRSASPVDFEKEK